MIRMTRQSAMRQLVRPVLLLVGLLAAGLLLRLLPAGGAAGLLREEAGERGAIDLMLVGAALCAVGLPRQAVCYACGYALGGWLGAAVALAAQVLGCIVNVGWARLVARDWAKRRIAGRLARLDRMLAARPFASALMLRLLPVGNNLLLNLVAGVSSAAALPFVAGSTLGYVPQTLVFVLAGAGTQLGRTGQIALAGVLLVLAAGLGWWLRQRLRGSALDDGLSADSAGAAPRPR